jgi:DNA-binding winged helix-turn-helix (wHTH) protein/TolB-like protein
MQQIPENVLSPASHFSDKFLLVVMTQHSQQFWAFGAFQVDTAARVLRRDGQPVALTPKMFDALRLLLKHQGRALSKEEMMAALWPDTFVEEANLTRTISRLRKALGDAGETFIATVPKFGYRFVAASLVSVPTAVELLPAPLPPPASEPPLVVERLTLAQTVTEEEIERPEPRALPAPDTKRYRWALAALAVVVVVLLAVVLWQRTAARETPPLRTLAVLPLAQNNVTDNSLGLKFADVLVTRLTALRGITVRPLRQPPAAPDEEALGRALQVDALVAGSIQQSGDRVRVTARLVDVNGRRTLWTGQFDEKQTALFVVQDAVADKVIEALAAHLTPAEKQIQTRRFTQDADAQHHYEKALFYLQRQRYLDKAAAYLRLALERDPNFALAYARLGEVQTHQTVPAAPGTLQLLEKAVALEPDLAEGWAALGLYQMFQEWNWSAAEKSLARALELNPNYVKAQQWRAEWLAIHRRVPEALAALQTALTQEPNAPSLLTDLGRLYGYARDYERGIASCQQALKIDPDYFAAHSELSHLYRRKGQEREAFEYWLAWRKREVPSSFHREYENESRDRAVFAKHGFKGVLLSQRDSHRVSNEPPMAGWTAWENAFLGEAEQALVMMEQATRNFKGGFAMPYLAVDPVYDPLRAEPRFQQCLRRLGLQP